MVQTISTTELTQKIRNSRIIDLRDKEFYYLGHIEGACWMPFQLIIRYPREVIDPEELVVLYDEGKGESRAEDTAEILEDLGYRNVFVYQEGWSGWNRYFPTALKDTFIQS